MIAAYTLGSEMLQFLENNYVLLCEFGVSHAGSLGTSDAWESGEFTSLVSFKKWMNGHGFLGGHQAIELMSGAESGLAGHQRFAYHTCKESGNGLWFSSR